MTLPGEAGLRLSGIMIAPGFGRVATSAVACQPASGCGSLPVSDLRPVFAQGTGLRKPEPGALQTGPGLDSEGLLPNLGPLRLPVARAAAGWPKGADLGFAGRGLQ
jgi:hypothetical protein